jgi:hypothetical protein
MTCVVVCTVVCAAAMAVSAITSARQKNSLIGFIVVGLFLWEFDSAISIA